MKLASIAELFFWILDQSFLNGNLILSIPVGMD